jgi:hypothetical protein
MMRKIFSVVIISAFIAVIVGCSSTPSPKGCLYTKVQGPFTITANQNFPKMGKAVSKSVLGLVAWGDCSVKAAAESAGITKIHHIDYEDFNIFFFYMEYTTVVYGE